MSYFYYDARIPSDKYTPKEHSNDELDALRVPIDKRDRCKNLYAEYKTCILVVH